MVNTGIVELHSIILIQLLIISSLKSVSRYVSYREASIAIRIVSWDECIIAALITGHGFYTTQQGKNVWHFTPRKYWLITQEAMAPSRHDWKIVDWDVKPQHNQPTQPTNCTNIWHCFGKK